MKQIPNICYTYAMIFFTHLDFPTSTSNSEAHYITEVTINSRMYLHHLLPPQGASEKE